MKLYLDVGERSVHRSMCKLGITVVKEGSKIENPIIRTSITFDLWQVLEIMALRNII